MLEEGGGEYRHERMTMQTLPGSTLEAIEPQFLFQLLVRLLANPSRLDGGRCADVGFWVRSGNVLDQSTTGFDP